MKRFVLLAFTAFVFAICPIARAWDVEVDDGDYEDCGDWESDMIEAGWEQVAWAAEGGAMFEYTFANGTVVVSWWDDGPQSEVIHEGG